MTQQDDAFDPWATEALERAPESTPAAHLTFETIEDVEPLDDQFGVRPAKTVPDALYKPLFGQPEPTKAELDAAGGDPALVPPMQTYAILDAAKIFALAETLEASGLEYRCLFKGDAFDDLKDAAPWIVRLEEGNEFTQNLFTDTQAPWHLWSENIGIYFRSYSDLDVLWKFFRKFTHIKDEREKWYLLRFWDARIFHLALEGELPIVVQILSKIDSAVLIRNNCAIVARYIGTTEPGNERLRETRRDLMLLWSASQLADFTMDSLQKMAQTMNFHHSDAKAFADIVLNWCMRFGLNKRREVTRICILMSFLGIQFDQDPNMPKSLQTDRLSDFLNKNQSGDRALGIVELVRKNHPELLDLISRRVKLLGHLSPHGHWWQRYRELRRKHDVDWVVQSLEDRVNKELYGAFYSLNPLVQNGKIKLKPHEQQERVFSLLIEQITDQIEMLK